jgi:hypothetical protein
MYCFYIGSFAVLKFEFGGGGGGGDDGEWKCLFLFFFHSNLIFWSIFDNFNVFLMF